MGSRRKLFGEVAFERGMISSSQLYEALALQAKEEAQKRPYRFLGQILIELGYLSEKLVLEVLNEIHSSESVEETVDEAAR